MAVSGIQTVDLTETIAARLQEIDGLRVYPYVSDAVRPPSCVIAQPEIDWTDNLSGFCAATWTFPLTVVVPRNNDRDAQASLSRLVMEIANALVVDDVASGIYIEPVDARPISVNVSGTDLPGYALNIRIRA